MNLFILSVVNDTTSYIAKGDLVDFYKDIASAQSTQFTIIIAVIGVVFTVVIGATWWWNYKGAKAQINEEMNTATAEIQKLSAEVDVKFNAFKQEIHALIDKKIADSIDEHLSQKLADYTEQIELIDKKNEDKLNDFQKTINNTITKQRAELSRVFALHCNSTSSFYSSFTWWVQAFELYNEIEIGEFAQISIKYALTALKKVKKEDVKKDDLSFYIERIKSGVPDILYSERKELLELLESLSK